MRHNRAFLAGAAAVLLVGLLAPAAQAVPLSARQIFFEINDTDGDAGIQIFLDGDGWDSMQVRDPRGNVILNILAEGGVGMQGITEGFFESAEPSFEVQPLEDLLARFPKGYYRFRGTSTKGQPVRGSALLTHALPDAPVILYPMEEQDDVDPGDTYIEWEMVPDPPGSRISGYIVIVEKDEGRLETFEVDVPRGRGTRVTVPPEFMRPGTVYKGEVLAIERSGNRTITEFEFETGGGGGGDDDDEDDDE